MSIKEQQQHDLNQATISKLNAETQKINKENKFYPWIAVSLPFIAGVLAVIIALLK